MFSIVARYVIKAVLDGWKKNLFYAFKSLPKMLLQLYKTENSSSGLRFYNKKYKKYENAKL